MSAWPIHSWSRRRSTFGLAAIVVPKVWRRSWKRSRPRPARAAAATKRRHIAEASMKPRSRRGRPGRRAPSSTRAARAGPARRRRRAPSAPRGPCRSSGAWVALAVARRDADRRVGEVDVAPAQRDQLPAPQAGERGGQEDRGVLLALGRTHQGEDLLGRVELQLAAGPVL